MVKNPPAKQETQVYFWMGRAPGERNGNPLQYSCLESPMDRGVWQATVHGGAKELDLTDPLNNDNTVISGSCMAHIR